MKNTLKLSATILALSLAVPAFAQQPGGAPMMSGGQGGPPPEVQQKLMQYQTLRQKLDEIRFNTLKKKDVKKRADALKKIIDAAMEKKTPGISKDIKKFDKLNEKFNAAHEKGDKDAANKLIPELKALQTTLTEAHGKIRGDANIEKKAGEFQKYLIAEMQKVDPNTEKLFAETDKLAAELQAAMGGGGRPPGQ